MLVRMFVWKVSNFSHGQHCLLRRKTTSLGVTLLQWFAEVFGSNTLFGSKIITIPSPLNYEPPQTDSDLSRSLTSIYGTQKSGFVNGGSTVFTARQLQPNSRLNSVQAHVGPFHVHELEQISLD